MAQIAVTLELADYGMTPGSEWVEARTLRKGFSVVVRDDYIFKRASRRYSSREGYNWRAFARCLPGLCEPEKINPDNDAARMIQVKGEVGLVAEILRFAYASGNAGMPEFVDLLIDQTDDCLLQAERITGGHLSAETQALLSEIDGNIRE